MSYQKPRIRGTTPEIEAAAKQLRKNITPVEQTLCAALRNRQLEGLKFRAQHPVGSFIIDFYCPAYRLMIEVDGDIHDTQTEYDSSTTDRLEAYGYKVLCLTNDEVSNDLSAVLTTIRQTVISLIA